MRRWMQESMRYPQNKGTNKTAGDKAYEKWFHAATLSSLVD